MRNNMLNGVDEELNQYRGLWTAAHADTMETKDNPMGKSSNSEQDVITQVSAKLLAIPNMTIQKARKLARAAQASHLNEKNIDVLYGTALDLWNTKEDA